MQVLKDEVRNDILKVAEKEFLNKGFKATSMRIIAKKSNTTLGNLYNYFGSKACILEAIVGELPEKIRNIIEEHGEKEEVLTKNNIDILIINKIIKEIDPKTFGLDILLSKPFVILMEGCSETKYAGYRESFIQVLKVHILEHLGDKSKEQVAHMLAISFLEAILFIGKRQKNLEEGIKELMDYCHIIIDGLLGYLK